MDLRVAPGAAEARPPRPAGSEVPTAPPAIDAARLAEELRAARAAAEAAGRAKSAFLATMSHEMRSPLTAIIGFSDMLASESFGELNDVQREHVDQVLAAGRRLLGIVDDVLDLAALEDGAEAARLAPVDVARLVREEGKAHGARVEAPGRAFRIEADGEARVLTDEAKLRRIVHHLLDNAAKFTPRGSVEIRAAPLPDGGVRIEVEDTGIGIPPAVRERVLEAFTQAEEGDTRRYGGLGLGLALCRRYAGLLGGGLDLRSEPGAGTLAVLTLPSCPALVERNRGAGHAPEGATG